MSRGRLRRAYRAAIASFVVAIAGGVTAAIGYATEHADRILGIGLALCMTGIGVGLVAWSKHLDADEHVIEERPDWQRASPAADREPDDAHPEADGAPALHRRTLLGLLGGSSFALVVGFVGPIGSLGPRPRGERDRTAWAAGRRLVTAEGRPVLRSGGRVGQLVTVFPDGAIGVDDSQVVLLRLPVDELSGATVAGGAVDGWVAYSKICTHAGCSVGLFGYDDRPPITVRELVCPCHQSVFDPLDGARPIGGPATRPLPQLPLATDAEGYLVADGDFGRPVGPIAWDEG